MTLSVYQHWDPLRTCVVGRSYPPEFYSWISVPHVRTLFERIAIETEEDFQRIISKLREFDVDIIRPSLEPDTTDTWTVLKPPPMTPRDTMVMIGQKFYVESDWQSFYTTIKDPSWLDYISLQQFLAQAPAWQVREALDQHGLDTSRWLDPRYCPVFDCVQQHGNQIQLSNGITGAMTSRIGKDLYFATNSYQQDQHAMLEVLNREFVDTRNHVVNTGGHGDGTYCPVTPGLIISLMDVPTYANTFPGWEVVYLPGQSWEAMSPFLQLKQQNQGRWWIPGFEHDQDVINTVETWLNHWLGYVEETVFDVNMLIIDPKNVMVFNENDTVFDAMSRYGITPHVVPFRHRYFWDGGIHCVTLDLNRQGHMHDFFPERAAHGSLHDLGRQTG